MSKVFPSQNTLWKRFKDAVMLEKRSVYMVMLKQTPVADGSATPTATLLAEQDGHIARLSRLKDDTTFPHLITPKPGNLLGHVVAVCTKEKAEEIAKDPGVTGVVEHPSLTARVALKEKNITFQPS